MRSVLATKEERHVYRRRNSHDSAHHPADLPARVDQLPRRSDAAAEREHVRNKLTGLWVQPVRTHRRRALVVRAEGSADVALELAQEVVEIGDADADAAVRGLAQLIRQVPGATPEHGVAQEPDLHPPDAREAVARDFRRNLAPLDGLVQSRQRLGTKERRCEELVLSCDLDLSARQVEDGAWRRRRTWSPRRSSSRPGCEAAEGSARSSGRTARRSAPVPCHTGCIARTPSHRSRREPSDGQTATAVRDVSNGSRRRPTRPGRYAICGASSSSSSWMEPCTANCHSRRHCSITSASA